MGGIGTLTLLTLSLVGFIFIAFNIKKKQVVAVLEPTVEEEQEVIAPITKENTNKFKFGQPVKENPIAPVEFELEKNNPDSYQDEDKKVEVAEELSIEVAGPVVSDEKKNGLDLEIEPVKAEEIIEPTTSE